MRDDLRSQHDLGEVLAQFLVQRADQVAVGAGQQAVGQFDHADASAQRRVNRPHFQADVSAADHQQRRGHVGQFQRPGRIHHPRRGQVEGRYPRGPRTAGQDAFLEAEAVVGQRGAADGLQTQRLPVFKTGLGLDDLDVALGGDLLQPAGERGDDLFLPRPHGVDVDRPAWGRRRPTRPGARPRPSPWRRAAGPSRGCSRGAGTCPPARLQIDQGDLHAQIGRQKCRGVTTRSAAENDEL